MEKPPRFKGKIFSFLPKTATVSFHNPPFSPGRDKRSENLGNKFRANGGKSFSGPIISIIPAEARRKSKNGSFDSQEPTSPKVSCMGQIKHKKTICKSARVPPSPSATSPPRLDHKKKPKQSSSSKEDKIKQPKRASSSIGNIFRGALMAGRKSNSSAKEKKPPAAPFPERAPSLSQMKRFASGRNTLVDFDWRDFAQNHCERKCYSDEEKEESEEEEEDHDDEVIIPHSAPIVMGGRVALEPRKEINLWKRRTNIAPIRPLELN